MLAAKHPVWTDKAVRFDEGPHTYHVKAPGSGKPLGEFVSVTTFIGKFFPTFDADESIRNMRSSSKWQCNAYFGWTDDEIKAHFEQNRVQSSTDGTAMHSMVEDKMNGQLHAQDPRCERFAVEHAMFNEFLREECEGKEAYRTEVRLACPNMRMAGSADLTMVLGSRVDEEGQRLLQLEVIDLKRSKEINRYPKFNRKSYINPKTYRGRAQIRGQFAKQDGDPWIGQDTKVIKYGDGKYIQLPTKGSGPASNLLNCNYTKYAIQGNMYAHMLEQHFKNVVWKGETYDAVEVAKVSLLVMHPNKPTYQYMVVEPSWRDEAMRFVNRRHNEVAGYKNEKEPTYHPLRFLTEEWAREKERQDEALANGAPVIGRIGTLREYIADARLTCNEEDLRHMEHMAPIYHAFWKRQRMTF